MFDWCNYWLNATRGIQVKLPNNTIVKVRSIANPSLLCRDGFSISIQGNSTAYCYPKEDNCQLYEHVELGYPSKYDDLIMEWIEEEDSPCSTVYGYVPVKVVNQLIEKHGAYDKEIVMLGKLRNILYHITYQENI